MLIRPDILPDTLLEDLLDEAGALRAEVAAAAGGGRRQRWLRQRGLGPLHDFYASGL